MDVTHGEEVEAHLEAFIGKRHDKRVKDEGERFKEESYEQNLREHNAETELSVLFQRRDFSLAQIERHRRNCEVLVARHEANLERVEAEIERRTA